MLSVTKLVSSWWLRHSFLIFLQPRESPYIPSCLNECSGTSWMLNSLRSLNSKQWLLVRGGNQDSSTLSPCWVQPCSHEPAPAFDPKAVGNPEPCTGAFRKSSRKSSLILVWRRRKRALGSERQESPAPAFIRFLRSFCPSSQEVLWRWQWLGRLVRDPKLHRRDLLLPDKVRSEFTCLPFCLLAAWPWKQKELALYSLTHGL